MARVAHVHYDCRCLENYQLSSQLREQGYTLVQLKVAEHGAAALRLPLQAHLYSNANVAHIQQSPDNLRGGSWNFELQRNEKRDLNSYRPTTYLQGNHYG